MDLEEIKTKPSVPDLRFWSKSLGKHIDLSENDLKLITKDFLESFKEKNIENKYYPIINLISQLYDEYMRGQKKICIDYDNMGATPIRGIDSEEEYVVIY